MCRVVVRGCFNVHIQCPITSDLLKLMLIVEPNIRDVTRMAFRNQVETRLKFYQNEIEKRWDYEWSVKSNLVAYSILFFISSLIRVIKVRFF